MQTSYRQIEEYFKHVYMLSVDRDLFSAQMWWVECLKVSKDHTMFANNDASDDLLKSHILNAWAKAKITTWQKTSAKGLQLLIVIYNQQTSTHFYKMLTLTSRAHCKFLCRGVESETGSMNLGELSIKNSKSCIIHFREESVRILAGISVWHFQLNTYKPKDGKDNSKHDNSERSF